MSYQPTPIDAFGRAATDTLGVTSVIDSANSSTVTLLANTTFTGTAVDVLNYAQINVFVFSDQPSAASGLKIQFSTDGVNWDHTHNISTLGGTGDQMQTHVHARFYRVTFTNGAINQTAFRLQSILRPIAGVGTIVETDDMVSILDDAILTKSILTGKNSVTGNTFVDAKLTPDGGLIINQNIQVDAANSSVANLAVNATFTGATVSNITASMIQLFLKADQNCTVFLDQSQDGVNFDITDQYTYYANSSFGINVGAFGAYYRARVKNIGTATTTVFRFQTIFVPIASQLPRSLSADGWFQTQTNQVQDRSGFIQYYTPNGEQVAVPLYQLVGSGFPDNVLDTNFWTPSIGTGGTVAAVSGQLVISTGTTANNVTSAQTVRYARFVAGAINKARISLQLPDTGTVNNTRRWGAFDVNDGLFFELAGTQLAVVTRKGGVDTRVTSGNFVGKAGTTYQIDTNTHVFEMTYTPFRVYFYIDSVLIHSQRFNASWSSTTNLPVRMENNNSGGSITNVTMNAFIAFITRMGSASTQPLGRNIAGAMTVTLKLGAGNLKSVVINNNSGTSITLYDNTAASGTILATISPNTVTSLNFGDISFSTGLTVVTVGVGINCTVIYE